MQAQISRIFLVLFLFGLLTGCRLAVIVGPGGVVESSSGAMDCPLGTVCTFGVVDTDLNETLQAVAAPGWHFVRWQAGTDFLCGNVISTTCVLNNTVFAGNTDIEALIASGKKFYVSPVFEPDIAGSVITDTVIANGLEWAQPSLFLAASWDALKAACPTGSCTGSVNGYSLDGWTWASATVVADLFNHYAPGTPCTPTCNGVIVSGGLVRGPAASDGFVPNYILSTTYALGGYYFGQSESTSKAWMGDAGTVTALYIGFPIATVTNGAWLYR